MAEGACPESGHESIFRARFVEFPENRIVDCQKTRHVAHGADDLLRSCQTTESIAGVRQKGTSGSPARERGGQVTGGREPTMLNREHR